MSLVEQSRASIQLAWLRLRLPRLLAAESFDRLLARLSAGQARPGIDFAALERALDRAEALTERLPLLPRTCLYRCLARYAVFRRHGFPADFVMAISPQGVDQDGHAWLEFDGKPYREEHAADFLVSFRHPARSA